MAESAGGEQVLNAVCVPVCSDFSWTCLEEDGFCLCVLIL